MSSFEQDLRAGKRAFTGGMLMLLGIGLVVVGTAGVAGALLSVPGALWRRVRNG